MDGSSMVSGSIDGNTNRQCSCTGRSNLKMDLKKASGRRKPFTDGVIDIRRWKMQRKLNRVRSRTLSWFRGIFRK